METKRISTKEIISYLVEKFPACFSTEGKVKPLKVGIFQDLAEELVEDDTISKTRLRQALRHYTSSWRYLKAIKKGAFRVDITGNDVAEIDDEQALYAAKTLKESQEKFGNKNSQDKVSEKPYKGKKTSGDVAREGKSSAKFKSIKSKKAAKATVEKPLQPITEKSLKIGSVVKVKIGKAPMQATITEVSDNDVSVQLTSGMVVKTHIKNIFTE